jgi:hypothetical protein
MGNDDEQRSVGQEESQGELDPQERQAIALERIAEAVEGLGTEFRKVGDALTRIANRVGRRDD